MRVALLMILLASCSVHQTFPTKSADEIQWKQEYTDGKITWEEYQTRLKSEKQP